MGYSFTNRSFRLRPILYQAVRGEIRKDRRDGDVFDPYLQLHGSGVVPGLSFLFIGHVNAVRNASPLGPPRESQIWACRKGVPVEKYADFIQSIGSSLRTCLSKERHSLIFARYQWELFLGIY